MRLSILAISLFSILGACTEKPPAKAVETNSSIGGIENSVQAGVTENTKSIEDSDAFTLKCAADYHLKTSDNELWDGVASFDITIDPRKGISFMQNWVADGYYSKPLAGMNNEIEKVTSITSDKIEISGLKLDRITGKMVYEPHVGSCVKSELKPIPNEKKF